MVKSVLFWLLANDEDLWSPWQAVDNAVFSSARAAMVKEVTGTKPDHDSIVAKPLATPRWMDLVDINENVEEARIWAVEIVQTMLHLAEDVHGSKPYEKMLLPFFEVKHSNFLLHDRNKNSIIELCKVLLSRLAVKGFYSADN